MIRVLDDVGWKVRDDLVFWPILKCGHTSMDRWLQRVGFVGEYDTQPEGTHFAVLREPYARYLSAVVEMHRAGHGETVTDLLDMVASEPEVWTAGGNPHFEPQCARVNRMPHRHLFRLEELGVLADWLEGHGLEMPPPEHKHATDADVLDYARSVIDPDPVYAYYAADLDLWRSCGDDHSY